MRITDLLKESSIGLGLEGGSKDEMIAKIADLMNKSGNISNLDQYIEDVKKRESTGTTGIGEGVAIPHAKSSGVLTPGLAAATVPAGTDYESLDGEVTKLFFMIAVPENSNDEHLQVLSRLSTLLMDEKFRNDLLECSSKEEFLSVIEKKEEEKYPKVAKEVVVETPKTGYDLVAVTGCPTGIAHTFMAKEGLENKAKELGYTIKVETHGSTGIENALTSEEIKNAKGVIIAADVNVNKSRFNGKKVVDTKVSDGINKAKELIERALNPNTPLFTSSEEVKSETKETKSLGQTIYKHLMSGVSHMLPFVVGGGILIALAFMFDDYSINPASFGSNTPLAATFMQIGGAAFGFMLPILAGFIGMSIADRPGLTVGVVGGYLANTGGAGFLGALAAGFLSGYIIILLRKLTQGLPKSLDGIKPMLIFPVFGILAIGLLMTKVFNPPLAGVNEAMTAWLTDMGSGSKIVLGLLLGGMMAVDMGGPVNKAAYVFGTASLAAGSSQVMAAVMAGGMVPPLALSISMLLFKNKYSDRDRQAISTNIIMGLSFITEGAIPFAAADPLRVIPASVLGASTAGLLSMLFNCSLRAPHGGLWVIGVISNPVGYLVAVLAGSLVGALALGLLKKDI